MASEPPLDVEWTQSYKGEQSRTGFLDLPREIRDYCYEIAFAVSGAIFIYSSDPYAYRAVLKGRVVKYKNEGPREPVRIDTVVPIGLLRACRQIHAESAEALYGLNTFSLYMSNADFVPAYCTLLRRISMTLETGRGIYSDDLEVMSYWWRRVFWPSIIDRSTKLLLRYPNLEKLTFPIKSDQLGQTWRPPFLAMEQKTRAQRVALAANWLRSNCPMRDERLRKVLHLEIMPYASFSKANYEGSSFYPDEDYDWDCGELAEAFQVFKGL